MGKAHPFHPFGVNRAGLVDFNEIFWTEKETYPLSSIRGIKGFAEPPLRKKVFQ
jgi:hypothetical protein